MKTTSFSSSAQLIATMRTFSIYIWMVVGMLIVSYVFLIGAITFSVVTQKQISQQNKTLISTIGKQELAYLSKNRTLTREYATDMGLVSTEAIAFISPIHNVFALNDIER